LTWGRSQFLGQIAMEDSEVGLVAIVAMVRLLVRDYCFVMVAELRYCYMECVTWVVHRLFQSELLLTVAVTGVQ
jgi:hypothetical protein